MDPIDKIVIARKFDVSTWLVPSLDALVQREKPLDLSEGNRLGLEWALKVAEVREYGAVVKYTCQDCSYNGPYYICGNCHRRQDSKSSIDYDDKIRKIFGLE